MEGRKKKREQTRAYDNPLPEEDFALQATTMKV